MPDLSFIFKLFSVILQYGILAILYYFLYLLFRLIYKDLHGNAVVKKLTEAKEAILVVLDANDEKLRSRRFAFVSGISIGRGKENDVVIEDTYVSHHHAVINQLNNLYVIEDLNSVNHTYLNDAILKQKTVLQDGDIIKIGLVTFKFER